MKLLFAALTLSVSLFAQTGPKPLPHDGFVGMFYYDPSASPKGSGEFGQFVQIPNAPAGTWLYNSFAVYGSGPGLVVGVPQTGLLQHVADFTPTWHLTANAGIGASFVSTAGGTNVGPSFAGGLNISHDLGKGFSVVLPVKVVNHVCVDPKTGASSQCNTLVGGVGISWGH